MPTSERSAISWVIIIAIGIVLGNTVTFMAYSFYSTGKVPRSLDDLTAVFSRESVQDPEQLAIQKRLEGTCEYWEEQLERKDSEQNRAFRDMACARAKGIYR